MVTKAQLKKEAKIAERRRNTRSIIWTLLGVVAGLWAPGYFMLAAAPSFYLGLMLVMLSALFLLIACFEFFRSKIVKAMLTFAVIVACCYISVWAKDQWKLKIQNDVLMHLDISMTIPPSGDAWKTLIKVTNNSSSPLVKHKVTCKIEALESGNFGIEKGSLTDYWGDVPLNIGGDSSNDDCLYGNPAPWFNVNGKEPLPITCADVTILVAYTVDSRPEVQGEKRLRFITNGAQWTQQPVGKQGAMCQVTP